MWIAYSQKQNHKKTWNQWFQRSHGDSKHKLSKNKQTNKQTATMIRNNL